MIWINFKLISFVKLKAFSIFWWSFFLVRFILKGTSYIKLQAKSQFYFFCVKLKLVSFCCPSPYSLPSESRANFWAKATARVRHSGRILGFKNRKGLSIFLPWKCFIPRREMRSISSRGPNVFTYVLSPEGRYAVSH